MSVTIIDNSAAFKSAKDEAVARALEAIGFQAEGYVSMLAPVDTGRLRASITHAARADEETVYVGTNVEYAAYQELGTRYIKPQPYLRPGVENHRSEYISIAKDYLKGG